MKKKKVIVEEPKKYPGWAYCNLVGSSEGIRDIANRKFRYSGRKTKEEWSEIFKKEGLS